MNRYEAEILRTLYNEPYVNQRILAESAGVSLGIVNGSLRSLKDQGYLNGNAALTAKALELIKKYRPQNAVILAAGVGMRMVPINAMTPKGLLEVHGEPLVERLIRQLHQAGVTDITVVVGFMKEKYEYLIDKYKVELAVNTEYAQKNNLVSLALVADRLSNTYIVPCDIWAGKNPFSSCEMYSWYMVSDEMVPDSDVCINRKMQLVSVPEGSCGNAMIGIAYLLREDAAEISRSIKKYAYDGSYDNEYWESVLYNKGRMSIAAKVIHSADIVEINTYEQLRKLDGDSDHLRSDALEVIAGELGCSMDDITGIEILKKGMTNRSFLFSAGNKKYIMRIPGEGTDKLIDRSHEAEVYKAISGLGICDDPVYIDPVRGYKITEFLDDVRVCDAYDISDIKRCMEKLRSFHLMGLEVGHVFDIYQQIEFYESLWKGIPSAYRDYDETKENVFSLRAFIEAQPKEWCLTHVDAVPDNFLFYSSGNKEELQLTDWEYAGMQDPHVDLAMFAIYSFYDKEQTDRLINIYFGEEPDSDTIAKIYCYVAACGLLWSNWTEYKSTLGVEFGEYGMRQYRYAKEYYRYAKGKMGEKKV